jgi:hypothetical protein
MNDPIEEAFASLPPLDPANPAMAHAIWARVRVDEILFRGSGSARRIDFASALLTIAGLDAVVSFLAAAANVPLLFGLAAVAGTHAIASLTVKPS